MSATKKRRVAIKYHNYHDEKTSQDTSGMMFPPAVQAIAEDIQANRRYFHEHPELSFKEVETAKYIAGKLREYGIEVTENVGKTGVVGVLKGERGSGPCIGFRADMDALPVLESTELPFQSKNKDVMHACGHDGHMAILLGAARIMATMKKKLKGTVKFLFQPAEEGYHGAREMIKDNALENPHVDEVYGLHLWNYLKTGTIAAKYGPMMASSDEFLIHVHGKGGHGAVPNGTNDAVVAASHLVTILNTIVSRNISPLDSAVLTVGQINGGFNYNIICDKVDLRGTVRTFTEASRDIIQKRMAEVCEGLSKTFNVNAVLDYRKGYPSTVNSSRPHVDKLRAAAEAVIGSKGIIQDYEGTMCSEDMSYFLNERPGCFFFVGSAPSDTEEYPHHKSNFTIDERALLIGVSTFVNLAETLLG